MKSAGECCDTCKFVLEPRLYADPGLLFCSEYCDVTSDAEREFFRGAQPGEFCVWPCPECGCVVEDEYILDSCCGPCAPKKKVRELKKLLTRALSHIPNTIGLEALRDDITKVLK